LDFQLGWGKLKLNSSDWHSYADAMRWIIPSLGDFAPERTIQKPRALDQS
jgi:hypothetical protein